MLEPSSGTCIFSFVHRHPEIVLLSLSQKFSIVIDFILSNIVETLVYDLHCLGASKLSDKFLTEKIETSIETQLINADETASLTLKLFWEINKENKINKFENRDSVSYPVWTTPKFSNKLFTRNPPVLAGVACMYSLFATFYVSSNDLLTRLWLVLTTYYNWSFLSTYTDLHTRLHICNSKHAAQHKIYTDYPFPARKTPCPTTRHHPS